MWCHVLLLVSGVLLASGDEALNSAVDGWLGEWYVPRLSVWRGLGPLSYSWTEGRLWWMSANTLSCTGGLVDLRAGAPARVGDAESRPNANSSRPLVAVDLRFQADRAPRFAFYGCGYGEGPFNGSLSGTLRSPEASGIQLLFTYRSVGWWCALRTLDLAVRQGLEIYELQIDDIPPVPTSGRAGLEHLILESVFQEVEDLDLLGDGPKCPDQYCKLPVA